MQKPAITEKEVSAYLQTVLDDLEAVTKIVDRRIVRFDDLHNLICPAQLKNRDDL